MEFRRLTDADAELFRQIRLHGLKESPEAFSADYQVNSARPLQHFAGQLRNAVDAFVIGAFSEDRLVGVGGFYRDDGPKLRHKGTIWGVYILPEHRGGGLGRRLIGEIITQATLVPDLQQINITVTAANARARQLYVSMGFETWGLERRALWIDGRFYDDEHMVMFLRQ
ncbi:MAG: GNAT family protein [Steroidobacter sp.]